MYSLRIFYDKDIAFWASVWASKGLLYGLCVFRLCVWRSSRRQTGIRQETGEATGKGTPSPSQGRATVRLPPSKFFFYFFLPYPIKAPIYPFSFPLRGFLFLCVYFPIRVSFRVSEGKNGENTDCFFLLSCVCVVIMRPILILCCVFRLCFSVVSPYCFTLCVVFLHCLLLWMPCFSLICPFFYPLWGFLRFYV